MADDTPLPLAVPILGMHRSGTSCLTRTLHLAGLHLGDDLINEGHADNLEGYWEARPAVAINDRVLRLAGGSWRDVPANLPGDAETSTRIRAFLGTLLVRPVAGWKDPRTCLTMDVWNEIFPEARLLHVTRHPLDVAISIQRREVQRRELGKKRLSQNEDLDHGLRLWEQHVRDALRLRSEGARYHEVRFEDLLASPRAHLEAGRGDRRRPGGEHRARARPLHRPVHDVRRPRDDVGRLRLGGLACCEGRSPRG